MPSRSITSLRPNVVQMSAPRSTNIPNGNKASSNVRNEQLVALAYVVETIKTIFGRLYQQTRRNPRRTETKFPEHFL